LWTPEASGGDGARSLGASGALRPAYSSGRSAAAAELLQELAHVYLGPDVKFPPIDDPLPGFILRFTVDRIGGVGPWAG